MPFPWLGRVRDARTLDDHPDADAGIMDVPSHGSIVDAFAGEDGHTSLKRGQSRQANVLLGVSNGDQVIRIAALAMKRGQDPSIGAEGQAGSETRAVSTAQATKNGCGGAPHGAVGRSHNECHYPYGDAGNFRFCGLKKMDGKSPYCPEHCAIAYRPSDR
jgi:GcrA cell cycle regulator